MEVLISESTFANRLVEGEQGMLLENKNAVIYGGGGGRGGAGGQRVAPPGGRASPPVFLGGEGGTGAQHEVRDHETKSRFGVAIMIDKKTGAEGVRDQPGDAAPAHQTPDRRWTDVMKHFWPALIGLAVGALAVIEPTE